MQKTILSLAFALANGWALSSAAQEPEPEVLRAKLASRLDAVEARMEAIPARDCTPGSRHFVLVEMIRTDIERAPLSPEKATRIEKGIQWLGNYAGFFASAADVTCADYDDVRSKLESLQELRDLVRERLTEAVVAIQSRLPATADQLSSVFSAPGCYYPSSHTTTTSLCLFEGTAFQAMRRFVQIVDGEIRARGGLRLGRDVMTDFFREDGGCFCYRDYANATLKSDLGGGIVFGSMAMRKTIRWNRRSMRSSMLTTLYSRLKQLPQLELPQISEMRSTERGSSSRSSPATVAGIYVARLVNAARSFAATSCEATVRNGARLANVFNSKAPADEAGEAARIYGDAAHLIRAELETISATGARELCDRRSTDMRALIDPALARVVGPSGDVETKLYRDAREREEINLRVVADQIRERYFGLDFGPGAR